MAERLETIGTFETCYRVTTGVETPQNAPTRVFGTPFQKGCAPGPGRPKNDLAALLCRRLFVEEAEDIYELLGTALKRSLKRGDANTFKIIAERAFGRLPQPVAVTGDGGGPVEVVFSAAQPSWLPK